MRFRLALVWFGDVFRMTLLTSSSFHCWLYCQQYILSFLILDLFDWCCFVRPEAPLYLVTFNCNKQWIPCREWLTIYVCFTYLEYNNTLWIIFTIVEKITQGLILPTIFFWNLDPIFDFLRGRYIRPKPADRINKNRMIEIKYC